MCVITINICSSFMIERKCRPDGATKMPARWALKHDASRLSLPKDQPDGLEIHRFKKIYSKYKSLVEATFW